MLTVTLSRKDSERIHVPISKMDSILMQEARKIIRDYI